MSEKIFQLKLRHVLETYKDETAVDYGGRRFSYADLDERSAALVNWMMEKGIGRETFIGILAFDREAFISSIIAVLKAGCVFVPLDPANPVDRLERMIDIAGVRIILMDQACNAQFSNTLFRKDRGITIEGVVIDDLVASSRAGRGSQDIQYSPEDKIYIYFTSGSSGVPRAVLGKNKSLLHYVEWEVNQFGMERRMRFSQLAATGFDAFLKEIFVTFFSGGTLCIPPDMETILDSDGLIDWVDKSPIHVLHCVPSLFRLLDSPRLTSDYFKNLKYVLLAGEIIHPSDLVNWYDTFDERIQVVNLYGATETTILKTFYPIRKADLNRKRIPIGKPMKGSRVIVLDKNMEVCSAGVAGEIYIRTPYRTFGYYNDPLLNAQRFIPNPFNQDPEDLIYKSGDLGRFLADGNIEFLGRIDRQVKVRGIRVELEEIEHLLLKHPGVKEAVVVKKGDSSKNIEFLAAYITASPENIVSTVGTDNDKSFEEDELIRTLKESLKSALPASLVPASVVILEKIPRLPNGKIKYDALPEPIRDEQREYVPPRNKLEEELLGIWVELLGMRKIGIHDSFFELGGNSLNVMSLLSKIRRKFDIEISFGELFNNPTLEKQAKIIEGAGVERYVSIEVVEKKEYYDVSNAQKRIWVLNQLQDAALTFNRPSAYDLEGKLDKDILRAIFGRLLERHEILRSAFITVDGEPKQKVLEKDEIHLPLEYIDLREMPDRTSRARELADAEVDIPFNLSTGPLLRGKLIHLEEETYMFVFSMHHIISDARSMEVLFSEFLTFYDHFAGIREMDPLLPPLQIQYKDFTAWQNKQLTGEGPNTHIDYWLDRLSGRLPLLELPGDYERTERITYEGADYNFHLDETVTRSLTRLARNNDATLFMIFLSILNVLLYRYTYTGQTDIIVGSTVSVRDHEQLADQIGFYINTLALRTRFRPDDTFLILLDKVKEVASGAYEHQVFPFDELVDQLEMDRDISRHPIFDVVIDMIDIRLSRQKETESALKVRPYEARYNKTKFDLTIYVLEEEEILEIILEYNAGLFKAETIRRMARRFQVLIHAVLENPGCQISHLPMDEAVDFPLLQPLAVDAESSSFTLPASYHQERLWFIDQFEAGKLYDSSPIYHNIPVILEITGALDAEKLEQSILQLIKRHQALRTRLIAVDNKPFQCVDDVEEVAFQLRTLSSAGGPLSQALEEAKRPFLMDREPLIRGSLMRMDQQRFMLVLTVHHIVADKYSLKILVREIFTLYIVYTGNRVPRLPGPSFQYTDFSQWQYRLPDDLVENLLFYWKRNLHVPLQALELPTDRPRAAVHIYEDAAQTFSLPEALSEKIRTFSQAEECSSFIVLLAAFKILLHRYTNQDEIIVGTSVRNRNRPGTEEIIGPIANLLVLRSLLDSQSTVYDVFSLLGKTVDEALRYQEMPFDKLVLELNPQKDMSRTALFDVLFQYEEYPFQIPALDNLEIKSIETNRGWGKYDLNMLIYPGEGKTLAGTLVYNARYFDETTISRLIEHYRVLLESILEDPHQRISQLCLLSAGEKQQLLTRWNDTGAHYPVSKTIHRLFADQVERTPDRAAVVYQGLQLSYRELDRQANRLAYHLGHSYGVQSGELIGIMVERSEKMISGLLGILKAGGAYIPIDPGYPSRRIDYILKDSETRLLITDEKFKDKIDSRFAGTVVDIDASLREDKGGAGWENSPEDTAYVIYTSGTTGQPKGCMISHKNVVRLLKNDRFPFDFDEGDVWIMAHSYCFDFSVWEMYGALLYGGRLIVPQWGEVRDISVFLSVIKGHGVSVLNQTPPAFYRLVTEEKETRDKILNRHLRVVIFGGDKLEPVYLQEWTAMYPLDDIRLVNMYGITETTVHVTYYWLTDRDINLVNYISPIGSPLPETTIYILNRQLNLQPIGVAGEFYVGGTGVARGYLNRPALTADKFLSVSYKSYRPYRTYFSKKIYRTGDLGRWLADGNIEFQGRVDHQVKIRGFRIEVGEIESQLLGHGEIKEALVIGREAPGQRIDNQGDGKSLCAYIVPYRRLEVPVLREYLANRLPEYMIPSYFVQLAKMPLTPNGKVDRKKLPEPEAGSVEERYTAPRDEVEKILMEIWLAVLGVKEHGIGIDSNFFELGGHSLKAAVLTSKIHKELNVKIPLEEMFITPTIRGLARYIKKAVQERFVSIAAGEEKKYYPLSSAQKRLFVIHRKNPENVNYNATQAMVLAGILDIENLKQVFKRLMERHESFRTSFALMDGQPFQEIHENVELEIEYFELTAEDTENSEISIIHDFIRPFNLSLAPLVRVGLIKKGEIKHILIVDMHHIISDYISLRILLRDFASLYKGEELPLLRLQYKDYTEWQNRLLQSGQLKHQEEYWLKVFTGDIPVLNLSTDYPRPPVQQFEGERIDFAVDKELYEKLAESMKDTKTTLYMFLLAVCNVLLWKLTQQEDIVIGTPVMGRSHNDLENIIGMFVGQLPMKNRPSSQKTFREFLEEVKISALNAYENQDYQFDELTRKLGLQGDVSRHPLFDVVFAIFNKEEEDYLTGLEDLSFSVYPFEDRTSKTDLRFAAVEMTDEIHMTLTYSSALFKRSTCEKMAERFMDILNQVVENDDMKLADITLVHSFSMAASSTLIEEEGDFGF